MAVRRYQRIAVRRAGLRHILTLASMKDAGALLLAQRCTPLWTPLCARCERVI